MVDTENLNTVQIMQYIDAAWRRKWLILIPFIIVAIITVYHCTTLPSIYRSETTILVEPQQVPEEFVQSTVTGSLQDRLNTIGQQILSRVKLEFIIKETGLYADLKKDLNMESIVNNMRKNIEINVPRQSRGRGNAAVAFSVAFYHKEPEVAQRITNKLASLYIEENLRFREDMARGTKSFLTMQLNKIENELKQREEALREFKQQFMGELPEQLETNLRALDQLQEQKSSVLASIRDAEDRQILLEQQLAEVPQYLAGSGSEEDLYRQLEEHRQALASLRTRYTDRYPDVIRLKNEVKELEQSIAGGQKINPGGPTQEGAPLSNPAYTRLKNQIDANRFSVESLRKEIQVINWRMKGMQEKVANIPQREQEMMTLTRDYQTIKESYDSMMERKINAEIAENMETRQKSEQFRIIDPANFPHKPVKPNRLQILAIGLALGLGIGGGLAFVLEFMDSSLRTVEEVKANFDLPVLGVIPTLILSEDIRRQRIKQLVYLFSFLGFVLILLIGIHLFVTRLDVKLIALVKLFL